MAAKREHWGSRLGFILAAAGSAIGLGSLWRFPYVVGQNGGGVFVFLYIAFLFLIVLPIFVAEVAMGRSAQKSPVLAYYNLSGKSENWRLAGWFTVLIPFLVLSFYSVVSGWGLNYILMSLSNFTAGRSSEEIASLFEVMHASSDINLLFSGLFIVITGGVIYSGVQKGIEHWSKILMPLLFIFLIGLTLFSMTLDGFYPALEYLFAPDFSKVTPSGILGALGLAFFTMSVGMGIIITYGSYMEKTEDVPKTSLIVALMTTFVSLLASIMIFPIIFTFGLEPAEGPGLVFKILPILFAKLPGTLLLSTVFFTLLVFTALTSAISLLEELVATVMDILNWPRHKAVIVLCIALFFMTIPSALSGSGGIFSSWAEIYGMDFFNTLIFLSDTWLLPIGGLLITIFVGWKQEYKFRKQEFVQGSSLKYLFPAWHFLLRYIAPIGIILVMLNGAGVLNLDKLFG